MPNRSEIQAFLIANGLEGWAESAEHMAGVEKVVEALGEVTEGMAAAYYSVIYQQMVRARELNDGTEVHPLPSRVWQAMWAARFRG